MKTNRKPVVCIIAVLLAAVMLFSLAGCGGATDEDCWTTSYRATFDAYFMDLADTTPQEWYEFLESENKDGRAAIFITGDTVELDYPTDDWYHWTELGETNLAKVRDGFAALGEGCAIELSENNTVADVHCGEGITIKTAREYMAQVIKWCAYLNALGDYISGVPEVINYPDAEWVCTCSIFRSNLQPVYYVLFADNTVDVAYSNESKLLTTITVTDEQRLSVTNSLRHYDVRWESEYGDIEADSAFIAINDADGSGFLACGGGYPQPEAFTRTLEEVLAVLTAEYPMPSIPADMSLCFGKDFMDLAGLTSYQWYDLLQSYGELLPVSEDSFHIKHHKDFERVELTLYEAKGYEEWKALGEAKLQEICSSFASLGEGCRIEVSDDNATVDIHCGEGISEETAETYAAQLKIWCTYRRILDRERFSPLKDINYLDAYAQ
ncbi:MAG: hypothetical protein E7559_00220 [Ruminococcaceae bacterium]|nr:hypothetical protein [Oscillospiraceae bacterium]